MCEKRVSDLVELVARNENFLEYKVEVHGKTGRGDGYLGKVTFVSVIGKTKNKDTKELNLVIKTSAQNELLRSQLPVRELFELEIYIYDKVVPTFKNFETEMGFESDVLKSLPTCYLTQNLENDEALILENLKLQGFDVANRKVPLSFEHIRLVLKSYGKWHAFSLALRYKRPETFKQLVKNLGNMWSRYILKTNLTPVFLQYYEEVRKFWENNKDVASVKFSEHEVKSILISLVSEDLDQAVIIHGDCWTNNFMFKAGKPTQVYVIDWQLSGLASPVLDLSYFIYTCVDTEKYKNVEDLLKIYHDAVCGYLHQLNCDPGDILPFSTLVKHWRKFSCYGLLFGSFILRFCLSESEEVPDFIETAEKGKNFLENFEFNTSNQEVYYKRVKDNILHYARNVVE
ncbi:uncharacterized protein LOC135144646 isoform X2 [Zophobas morio]|uniref:uncharacterized protein LOC135144646 isoform X2 n=1 Tax=Zophobas morio TaxID=2755281 RepID=UPI0030830BBC